ncbi:two-component system sensor histidine kinase NtrB [Solidesulfovibrio carbinolicus]|uniref:histidine kinase n=1 Tax=Solidesulfovibrio carbinolicus TaxID=296842 RepID=A0A4P6HLE4_9BACT|nr:ATP-binding protein [Solidesulfovibrio carbinolicus]QAZ67805.1 PAS domain-containing sensor histidine kinase [Solidesulfovibrio carbinolicus]
MTHFSDIIAQNVVESLPVGLLIVDHAGAFTTVNPAAATILGYSRQQLLGRGWGDLFFENEANARFNQIVMDVIQNELVGLCRVVPYAAPDGRLLELSITSSYLSGGSNTAGVVVILHDLTELSRMQRRETDMLKEVNRIQQEKIRGLNKLAASVAHQIRNPAFAIGGFASRLARQLASLGIDSSYPGIILDEAKRLETLVRTVGRFAALGPARPQPVRLAEVADQAMKLAQTLASGQAAGAVWRFDLPEVQLVVDRDQIAGALAELFRNSLECAAPGPVTIDLTAAAEGERLELAVTDDGPGIRPADAPHVFDPFYSGRPDKAGMGLTLAQEIVLEHNGSLVLDSGHVGGARFVLTIPRFPSHLMSRLEEPEPAASGA